jgi:hypothetical protein
MQGTRWTFETTIDLGELGIRNAIIRGDVKVEWGSRDQFSSDDEIRVKIVSLEVFFPGKYAESEQWDNDHRLVDFTDFLRTPNGLLIKQRLETHLEDDHYQEVLDHFRMRHIPDRHEDAI